MNIAHTKIDAAASAKFCGYSLVRRVAASCVIGVAVMSAAIAGPGDRDREAFRAGQAQQREAAPQRQYEGRQQREFNPREFEARAEERRRELQSQQQAEQNQNAEAFRRSGRLTPDERRDLRRQINEAGNDIYPNRRNR
jgi:hypothetical protein